MSAWLVLPMKSLRQGKTRLAPILDVTPRRALLERMFRHTLDQAALFPGLNRTLLLTRCTEARALAMEKGVRVLEEKSESGLNSGLRQAQLELRNLNASKMLIVHCDLPLLGAEDLRRLAAAGSEDLVGIAPDRARQGTNGLCLATVLDFVFSFGPNSFARHLDQAGKLGLQTVIVEREGLAFDVDTPEDFGRLLNHESLRAASKTA